MLNGTVHTRAQICERRGKKSFDGISAIYLSISHESEHSPLAVKGRGTVTDKTDKPANAAWIVKAMCTVIDNTYKTCKCWMVFFYQNLLYHNFLIVEARFCSVCKPLLALISIKLYASTIKQA